MLPTIQNPLNAHSACSSTKLDLRLDGPSESENSRMSRKTRVDFPKLNPIKSNHNDHPIDSSADSYESDDGCDRVSALRPGRVLFF